MQRGLRQLSNVGESSPAAEAQRLTPLQCSPASPRRRTQSFEDIYKSVWECPRGALGQIREQSEAPRASRASSAPKAQAASTPGSKVVPKSLFQSARKDVPAPKGGSPTFEAPPTKAQGSGDRKPKKKAITGSGAASEKQKVAPNSSETKESDPLFEEHDWVPAAKDMPKKNKSKKVAPSPGSDSDSSKLPSDKEPDVKDLATELAV